MVFRSESKLGFTIISLSFTVMFRGLNKLIQNAEKNIDNKTQQLHEEEEHKALQAYLLGHGHDRAHSQILLGTCWLIQLPDRSS